VNTAPARTVAAFDLDGTLTRGDTLLPFLWRVRGGARTSRALLVNSVLITRAVLSAPHRHRAKEAVIAHLLAGQDAEALRETAESFADEVVARRLRPAILDRVELHRAAGHELVIVSASPELYVGAVGRRLAFDAVLATRLEVGPDGRLTGRLAGPNSRGAEKVARLRAWTAEAPAFVYAYGDTAGDRELLATADAAFRRRRSFRPRGRFLGRSAGRDPFRSRVHSASG
jgi:phosphatidylglycerophosphatase C